ncbi:MAG: hypothetical protein MPJ50_13645 [Pirellulales bacterium]|nr:hypothetical protein [Pirellulales bacterium]
MLISRFESERTAGKVRHTALVEWEHADRPAQEIFFETDAENLYDQTTVRADPFLVAAIFPALECGESRVHARGVACPELLSNLRVATMMMAAWRKGVGADSPTISASNLSCAPVQGDAVAGCMLSGGIDSLATLAENIRTIPHDHPLAIKRGILVNGFDIGGYHEDPTGEIFARAESHLTNVAGPHGVQLCVIRTNLIELFKDVNFWASAHHGAGCAATGHFLGSALNGLTISSAFTANRLEPWGSVAWLDPYFSSASLRVIHEGAEFNRLEKTKQVCSVDEFRRGAIVCYYPERAFTSGALNCGECAKCVRTKLAYLACGCLDDTSPFANRELSPELVGRIRLKNTYSVSAYEELLESMAESGNDEVLAAMQRAVFDYHVRQRQEKRDHNPLLRYSGKVWRKLVRAAKVSSGRP